MTAADLLDQVRAALADRYAVERELGRGGMATVYLAADRKHHRSVAIKVLNPELGTILGPERFLREIEIAAGLTHPHILPLLDSGEAGGLLYYVMPFVEGESLRDRLSREKQLPVAESVRIAREVAAALAYAHSDDVVHRDIKPENVLLSGGEAVVADFGIARAVTAAGGQRLTDTGFVIGTPAYMSPEQATAERQLDGRSDTYSLGCVLYEMLAGQPPFTGPTVESVVHQHLAADAPAVTAIRSTVPAAVAAAIGRALAKTPADRFATAAQFAEALASAAEGTVPPVVVRPRVRWMKLGAGLGLAAAAAVAVLLGRNRSPVIAAASVVAVVPFAPSTPDTGLTRLGRDLVVTLSANLDGVGEIRTVDALTILAHTGDPNQSFTRDDAAALARRLGASSVVQGSLLRAGAAVRLELGLFQTDRDAEVAHASVVASPGDFNALTDSVTWALLRQIWRAREPPTPSLGAVTTRSLPALRAFLEGERSTVDGRWPEAEAAFARAIEADSAFWLAYWRYAYARNWNLLEPDTAIVSAYRRHRDALPERERLLVEAELADSASARLGLLEEVTRRFPDYWPGWMEYADWLVHFGPLLGPVSERARAALERAIALNPRLVPAWTHLAWMSVMEGDSVALSRAVATFQRLGAPTSVTGLKAEWESPRLFRVLDRLLRNGGAADPSLVDSAVAAMTANDAPWLWFGFPAAQIKVSRQVRRRGVPAPESAIQLWFIAMSWAARGAWDSAAVALDDYIRGDPDPEAALRAYGLAVAGEWLGALDDATAARFRSAVAQEAGHGTAAAHAELDWLDGIRAATSGDAARVTAARAALRRSTDSAAALLEGSLSAFQATMSGAPAAAGRALAALERERAERTLALTDPDGMGDNHPFARALDRLAASRWLLAAGDTTTALTLLAWHDEFRLPMAAIVSKVLSGLVHLEIARIETARGRVAPARLHYEQFLRRYDMPVAAHRHLVTDARRALGGMR